MKSDFVSVIILAAGRPAGSEENKLLEVKGSTTRIGHVVSEALKSKASQVIVVCGYDAEKIKRALRGYRCDVVFNLEFERGQSFSVRKGLSRVSKSADAVMVLPADIALVDHDLVNAVIDEYSSSYAPIVTAGYRGRLGHPILFDKNLFGELEGIDEQTKGLLKVLSRHRSQARLVETSEAAVLDIVKEEDLHRTPGGQMVSKLQEPPRRVRGRHSH